MSGDATRAEIQGALGIRDRKYFRQKCLRPALDAGLVEMTLPDKPLSSRQRYLLTAAGRACLRATPGISE